MMTTLLDADKLIAQVRREIDAGDDAPVPVWADLLDDSGRHDEADTLRAAFASGYKPRWHSKQGSRWWIGGLVHSDNYRECTLPQDVYDRLPTLHETEEDRHRLRADAPLSGWTEDDQRSAHKLSDKEYWCLRATHAWLALACAMKGGV
jgi:hypothetical protein